MNLDQFNDLEFENMGIWPKEVKIVFGALLAIIVLVFSYYFVVSDEIKSLSRMQDKEQELRQSFKQKYQMASNLKLYREQLTQLEDQFSELLKMLPSQNEMPGLLDDLTFVATDAGLKINRINWEQEIPKDFYLEFPIKLSVKGDYHELGTMVSSVAKLPRIVSLHDFVIKRSSDGQLEMEILAKTYRFKNTASEASNKKQGGR
ncbi:pilus assembly protein PilP [Parashewanella curva]|uniref:Pilus assembly protein PilP n=1 Tax=Parashewanella curva TaxID=2338552 RepID=A0A3L8PVK8_9GAMM|nr:type 4a pilus biogenesis protein PilO [Parashewanella curva]RLV59366.1 pilus assembly protein PilP [Parashewanella curva]